MRFSEVQWFRQWWLLLVVLSTASIGWVAWTQQVLLGDPFGDQPASDPTVWALWSVTGVALPAALAVLRLETEVDDERLRVRLHPLRTHEIPLTAILDQRVIEYRPLAGYLVLGYGRTPRGEVVWRTGGTRGVRLSLGSGEHVVIGSRRPEELAAALTAAG